MAQLYDSQHNLQIIDLTSLSPMLEHIYDNVSADVDVNQTLLLNALLPFVKNFHARKTAMASYLIDLMSQNFKEDADLPHSLRLVNFRRLIVVQNALRETSMHLSDLMHGNNLYNHSGVLQIESLDADRLNAVITSNAKATCHIQNPTSTNPSSLVISYSIFERSRRYLNNLILSR